MCKSNFIKLSLSLFTILLGTFVYIFLRPSENIYFISLLNLNQFNLNIEHLPNWIYNISTALHTYSMSLLSSVFVESSKKNHKLIVSSWVFINIIFEIIQYPNIRNIIFELFQTTTLGSFINNLSAGTYDINDIMFTVIGGLFAYITLQLFKKD